MQIVDFEFTTENIAHDKFAALSIVRGNKFLIKHGDDHMPSESDENNSVTGSDIDEFCTTCHQYFDKEDECWGNYVPLTRDEEAILARMREVKAKVAAVKKRLNEIEGKNGFQIPGDVQGRDRVSEDQALWLEQNQRMATLREEWQELDLRRQEAASFRMKILGHEE